MSEFVDVGVRPPKVMFAYLHEFEVSHAWHESFNDALFHEMARGTHVVSSGSRGINGLLGWSRNQVVKRFLASDCTHLFWSDTDMGFLPDSVERLLARDFPIVGGLYFGSSSGYPDGYNGYRLAIFPQIYDREPERGLFLPRMDYAKNAVVKANATGSGFILIRREVFENVRELTGADNWYSPHPDAGEISEDLAFSLRCMQAGIQLYVDTAVKATHHKSMWVSEEMYQPMTFGEDKK